MSTKAELIAAYQIYKKQWLNDDNDDRREPEMTVDFIMEVAGSENRKLVKALKESNHLLSGLLIDPLVQKDQKQLIRQRYENNQVIIFAKAKEVSNA